MQGTPGLSNVGDPGAAVTSVRKAVALLEPLAARLGETRDRAALANAYVTLAGLETNIDDRRARTRQAVALLEAIPRAERTTPDVLSTAVRVWFFVGRQRIDAKQVLGRTPGVRPRRGGSRGCAQSGARESERQSQSGACTPATGTTLEMLARPEEAIAAYRRALALARDRAERLKGFGRCSSRSVVLVSTLGAALVSTGDIGGAREQYQLAIMLRQAVADADPDNDRATQALAYGHQRMAWVEGEGGDLEAAVASYERALTVYRRRADAHPERDHLWSDTPTRCSSRPPPWSRSWSRIGDRRRPPAVDRACHTNARRSRRAPRPMARRATPGQSAAGR